MDVNVGLPRCGCRPEDAGRLADLARRSGLEVLGVMGYEGHIVGLADREQRSAGVEASMWILMAAHEEVGGEIVSGGGTGTYDLNTWVTEMQAGSYALMDTAYGSLGLPSPRPSRSCQRSSLRTMSSLCATPASSPSGWTTATRRSRATRSGSAPTST